MENAFPRCRKCSEGDLVPLSDFGSQGASIEYKAWVCTVCGQLSCKGKKAKGRRTFSLLSFILSKPRGTDLRSQR